MPQKPGTPQNIEKQPPINISNLETSMMEHFGQEELEFTQNSVPFAYDGEHLLWMNYLP
jgi:hypothetical protein